MAAQRPPAELKSVGPVLQSPLILDTTKTHGYRAYLAKQL